MKTYLAAARALVVVTILAACGGNGTQSASSGADAPERAEINVGLLPIVDVAPVYLAIERGLFADEGLSVTTELVQGGAAAIPALVSGDLDVAYGNWVSFLLANQGGIELRAVADGVVAAPGFTEILALPASGLEGNPAALAGATVAVNTLGNVGELAVRSTLRAVGVDADDVQLVEIPFPDMGAALERGEVDAIWASEPVPTIVKADLGAVVVIDSFVGEMDAFPVAGYQATRAFTTTNPRTVAAFQRALEAAAALIAADPTLVAGVVPEYTSLTPDLAGEIALPRYGGRLAAASLQRVNDYLVEFEMLDASLDTAPLVLAAAPPE